MGQNVWVGMTPENLDTMRQASKAIEQARKHFAETRFVIKNEGARSYSEEVPVKYCASCHNRVNGIHMLGCRWAEYASYASERIPTTDSR